MSTPLPPSLPTAPRPTSRSRRGALIALALLVLLAVAGGAYALTRSSAKSTKAASSPSAASGSGAAKADRLRGRVQSLTGDTLVVLAKKVPTTVTLSSSTKFGNKKNPASRADIKPGVTVIVVGPIGSPTRVLIPPAGGGKASASPSS